MKHEYLSDKEVAELIEEVERNSMRKAPAYLKKQILNEIKHQTDIRKQLLIYELKVAGLVAAAILMLFLFPVSASQGAGHESIFLSYWNTVSGVMLQYCDITSNALLHPNEFIQQLWQKDDETM